MTPQTALPMLANSIAFPKVHVLDVTPIPTLPLKVALVPLKAPVSVTSPVFEIDKGVIELLSAPLAKNVKVPFVEPLVPTENNLIPVPP